MLPAQLYHNLNGYVMDFPKRMRGWLYEDNWSKDKLAKYEALSNVPVLGSYMNYLLDVRADEEYLRRYGLSYSDVHDPRKLKQTGSGTSFIGGSMNFVSSNVRRLY